MKEIYNRKEFAKIIGVSIMTMYRLEEQKLLVPHRTVNGKAFYTKEHITAYYGGIDVKGE